MKIWPADAVMIVCSSADEANRANMESVHAGACRDCGAPIVYDGFSFRRASIIAARTERPVKFFCIECAVTYDRGPITHLEDHRGRAES